MKIYLVYKSEIEADEAICCFVKKEEAEKFINEIQTGDRIVCPEDDDIDNYILLPNDEKYEGWFYRSDDFEIKELDLI